VGLVLAAVILLWGLAGSVTTQTVYSSRRSRMMRRLVVTRPARAGGAVLAAVAAFYLASWSLIVVPGAHIACVYDPVRGGIQDYTLPEGLRLVFPWVKTALFSVQTQEYTMSAAPKEGAVIGDDSIACETNEGLKVRLDLTVLFHVDPRRAPWLWRKLGAEYNEVFVRPVTRERIRMVVAKYSVQDVYSGRRSEIEEEITRELRKPFEEEGLVLEQILLRNVAYAYEEFAQAIADKQSRQQQVITEKRRLEQAEFDKQATINQARGDAKAIALRAKTLAANPEVVRYELAQKIGPRIKKAYLSQDAVPLPGGGGR